MSNTGIASRLSESGVCFYHAINLRDFVSYCECQALLSRTALKEHDPEFTRFWSDSDDEQRGVLGRTFGNVYDFGAIFANAKIDSSPNIYGTITLVFSPQTYLYMEDMILTPRSIVSLRGNWRDYAIKYDELDEMLRGDGYGSVVAKEYQFTEVSCSNPKIPFDTLQEIIVEPIQIAGSELISYVQKQLITSNIKTSVVSRSYRNIDHLNQIQELATILEKFSIDDPRPEKLVFGQKPLWLQNINEKYHQRFETWMTYLYNGTIIYLRERTKFS